MAPGPGERSVLQKRDRLRNRVGIPHQKWMRTVNDDIIGHAVEFGVCHRHPSIMRLRQERRGEGVNRTVARDDADGVVDRRQHRLGRRIALCAELLSGRSEEGAVGGKIFQAVGHLAAAIGRAEHYDVAQPFRPVICEIDAGEQAAHGMADKVHAAFDVTGETLDGRMDVFGERLQRLMAAGVRGSERDKARGFDRCLHFVKRARGPADGVQQDDAVLGRLLRSHLYSRSSHHGK
jgi:hypothetical protein